jgi:hypothetical protein
VIEFNAVYFAVKTTHKLRKYELSNKYAGSDSSLSSPGGSGEFPIAIRSTKCYVNFAPGRKNFSDP